MGRVRNLSRIKKKLVMLTGTKHPGEDLRRLTAFHGIGSAEHVLRVASPKKLALQTKAVQEKFPELGRRIIKKPVAERAAILKKLDAHSLKAVETGLKGGFSLDELLQYPNRTQLSAFLERTTPERVRQLKNLGLNEVRARPYQYFIQHKKPNQQRTIARPLQEIL